MRTMPSALALISVAATFLWLVRRRRRVDSRPRAPISASSAAGMPSNSLMPPPPTLPRPAANECLPLSEAAAATSGTLSRSPSRVQLDASSARFGLDIGGSLTKFIYLEQHGEDDVLLARARRARERAGLELHLSVDVPALNGTLHFAHFQTSEVEKTVKMLKRHRLCDGVRKIHATGGGAHKYRTLIESTLNTMLSPCNELEAVVLGICLMAKSVSDECYTLQRVDNPSIPLSGEGQPQSIIVPPEQLGIERLERISKPFSSGTRDEFFPFLLCNVGTGVSILHVESERSYTRVSGTAIGGGTFMGLTRLLTQMRHFEQALDVAGSGDARRVDMLVSDIYGSDTGRSGLNLPGDLTASFFAKNLESADGVSPREQVQDDDICKALVVMIAQNLAQIAHLNARIHGAKRVFFTGNFLRNNDLALRTIVYTMQRWSQLDRQRGEEPTEAIFFRHEGYFGAIGAFLQTLDAEFVSDLDFSACPTPGHTSVNGSSTSSPKAERRELSGSQPTPVGSRREPPQMPTMGPTASLPPMNLVSEPSRGATSKQVAVGPSCSGSAASRGSSKARSPHRGSPLASPKSSPHQLRKGGAVPWTASQRGA